MRRIAFILLISFLTLQSGRAIAAARISGADRLGGVVLVLSGGGTKGFAHIGVLKVLERENIPIAGIVGTSMGAIIGGLYATGYSADEIRTLVMETDVMSLLADSGARLKPDAGNHRPVGESITLYQKNLNKDFSSAGPLGMLRAASLTTFLSKYTGHIQTTDFDYLPIPFACVAANLLNGETVVLRDGSLASAIRASAAIPGLLDPWPLDGRLLVDGGLVANLPVLIAKEIFPEYPIIAVNLAGRTIEKTSGRFTNMGDVLIQTIDIMTIEQTKENEKNADLVIYPELESFSTLDSSGYEKIYEIGFSAAAENAERITAISRGAPAIPDDRRVEVAGRIVRNVRVEGLSARATGDIERNVNDWIGQPYGVERVNKAIERLSRRDEVATVDVDLYPSESGVSGDVDIVFSIEKRTPYEIAIDGYTTSLHPHRWMSAMMNARDLASDGDSANLEGRMGNDEWGAAIRYFTPMMNYSQWGFSLSGRRDDLRPEGMDDYYLERYAARALYYRESSDRRVGLGLAGEKTNSGGSDKSVWGPYLYFNKDTLDNQLSPNRGYSLNGNVWWNTNDVLVSRTELSAYLPWRENNHIVLNLGLETGDRDSQAYRVMLGDQEELFSLARHPLVGDQSAWAHVGLGRNFYTTWWGSLRGEVFASYGMVMDRWSRVADAWETGLAFSVPGQFFNGRVLLVYDDDGEVTVGFTIGIPRWWSGALP
ncbi:MAG: patatin-like phospholipase family protein [Synergistaceae bacterium]|jgi:NTE family protein|nr:patatin-like phospholipase family protein [Synergistaceae bacterium]